MRGRKRHRKKLKQQILRDLEARLRQQGAQDVPAILRDLAASLDRLLHLRPR